MCMFVSNRYDEQSVSTHCDLIFAANRWLKMKNDIKDRERKEEIYYFTIF